MDKMSETKAGRTAKIQPQTSTVQPLSQMNETKEEGTAKIQPQKSLYQPLKGNVLERLSSVSKRSEQLLELRELREQLREIKEEVEGQQHTHTSMYQLLEGMEERQSKRSEPLHELREQRNETNKDTTAKIQPQKSMYQLLEGMEERPSKRSDPLHELHEQLSETNKVRTVRIQPQTSTVQPVSKMSKRNEELGEKSREENRKVPEVESDCDSGTHLQHYGSCPFALPPPPPKFHEPIMPSPCLKLRGTPFPSQINEALSPTFVMPMSSVFSKVSTPPSITAASPFDKDATSTIDPTKIKRTSVINPFTVWSRIERRKISKDFPHMHNAEISKELEKRWKMMNDKEKEPYTVQAEINMLQHLKQTLIKSNEELRKLELQLRNAESDCDSGTHLQHYGSCPVKVLLRRCKDGSISALEQNRAKTWPFGVKSEPVATCSSVSSTTLNNPVTLKLRCRDILLENRKGHCAADIDDSVTKYCAVIEKDFKKYTCVRVQGNGGVLQGSNSTVKLFLPKKLNAFVMGHAHTDAKPFTHLIPKGECLVSPIADYNCTFKEVKPIDAWFKIVVPHCIRKKEHLKNVKIRHGDIYRNVPFVEAPTEDCHFEVDEQNITIFTRHFSQFICTACRTVCYGDGKAFIFGGLSPLEYKPLKVSLRLYVCSPLYRIDDYRLKLIQIEKRYRRHPVEEMDISWDPSPVIDVTLTTPRWTPRLPIKSEQTWDPQTRKLIHTKELSEMSDLLYCHNCKLEPSIVAHFDLTLPESSTERPNGNVVFSGNIEMNSWSYRDPILETAVDVYPTESGKIRSNEDHLRLQSVTKQTICSDEDLYTFCLNLGLTVNQIRQKRTNNPNSIEIAALEAVTEWWDSCIEPHNEKVKIIADCVEKIGKANLVSSVMEKLGLEPSNWQHDNFSQANGIDNNVLNGNDGSVRLEQCSPQRNGLFLRLYLSFIEYVRG